MRDAAGAGIVVRVPAKVNLVLDVGARRADGYHGVRTILQAVSLFDYLSARPAPSLTLTCSAGEAIPPRENLAWRAAELLGRSAGVRAGASLRLRKYIPSGAGLGGGSADAAAALIACARLWQLDWSRERLADLAAQLGSDVPFFLWGGTAFAQGRGEVVEPLPALPPWPALLAKPARGSPTPRAYALLDAVDRRPHPDPGPLLAAVRAPAPDRGRVIALLGNSFEAALLPARPDIAALRQGLLDAGALACVVCGSGSAVCALAPSAGWSRRVSGRLRAAGTWARAVHLWPGGVQTCPEAAAGGEGAPRRRWRGDAPRATGPVVRARGVT